MPALEEASKDLVMVPNMNPFNYFRLLLNQWSLYLEQVGLQMGRIFLEYHTRFYNHITMEILYVEPNGTIRPDIVNTKRQGQSYQYFYPTGPEVIEGIKNALTMI